MDPQVVAGMYRKFGIFSTATIALGGEIMSGVRALLWGSRPYSTLPRRACVPVEPRPSSGKERNAMPMNGTMQMPEIERSQSAVAEPDERYLTVVEVAQRYRVSDRTVRNWRRRGLLGAPLTLGRSVRYRASELPR